MAFTGWLLTDEKNNMNQKDIQNQYSISWVRIRSNIRMRMLETTMLLVLDLPTPSEPPLA